MPIHKQLKQHKLLLDTHIWIWLMLGDKRMSKSFRDHVNKAVQNENIFISAISVWELGMLVERKRILLEIDTLDWVEQALDSSGIHLLPITPFIAIQSSRLPENPHGDPADRILIATASEKNAILITHDKKIIDYGKGRFVKVYDPSNTN